MQLFVFDPRRADFEARPFDLPLAIDRSGGLFPAAGGVEGVDGEAFSEEAARLVPFDSAPGRRSAALFTRWEGLRVNGASPLPMTVLCRGDEIRLSGVCLFFTDERPLRVEAFAAAGSGAEEGEAACRGRSGGGSASPTSKETQSLSKNCSGSECARCHGAIRTGDPVIRCPVCGILYMAQPVQHPNCWAFGPCISCGRDPSLEFVWRPSPAPSPGSWADRPWRKALPGAGQLTPGVAP